MKQRFRFFLIELAIRGRAEWRDTVKPDDLFDGGDWWSRFWPILAVYAFAESLIALSIWTFLRTHGQPLTF
jgi:hypothetical protein